VVLVERIYGMGEEGAGDTPPDAMVCAWLLDMTDEVEVGEVEGENYVSFAVCKLENLAPSLYLKSNWGKIRRNCGGKVQQVRCRCWPVSEGNVVIILGRVCCYSHRVAVDTIRW